MYMVGSVAFCAPLSSAHSFHYREWGRGYSRNGRAATTGSNAITRTQTTTHRHLEVGRRTHKYGYSSTECRENYHCPQNHEADPRSSSLGNRTLRSEALRKSFPNVTQ